MARLFFQQLKTTAKAGLLCSLTMGMITVLIYRNPPVFIWTALMCFAYIGRSIAIEELSTRNPDLHLNRNFRILIYSSVFLLGVGWGVSTHLFLNISHAELRTPMLIILVGIMTLSAPMISAKPLAGIAFVIPLLVSFVIWVHEQSGALFWATPIIMGMIAVATIGVTYRFNGITRRNIRLRLDKEALIEELTEAKQEAENSAMAKSAYLATMSHEIRTPINGLMGMLDILKETRLNAVQDNYLNTASRSAESLLQLLNDILDYSKIEVGKLELEHVPFDWVTLVGEIAMMNRVLASNKGIGFHLDIPAEGTSIVIGDPTRLRQILNNLLSNALKFTPEGSITLKVEIEGETNKQAMFSFSVKDTGIGISAEAQKHLFQKFQQANLSTARNYGGSGLGLSISQQLAHMMGGSIQLFSEPEKGSEFILFLNLPKASPESVDLLGSSSFDTKTPRFNANILLVEDDPVSQRVAVIMLKGFGITPVVVNTGKAAILASNESHFDLIFMDIRLPDMEGFDAAAEISASRAQDENARARPLTIIALSGADTEEDRRKARTSGIRDFLPKPVRKQDMRLCLERYLGKKQACDSVPAGPAGNNKGESSI